MYIKKAYRLETPRSYLLTFVVSVYFSVEKVCERKAGTRAGTFMKDLFPRHTCASFPPEQLKIGSVSIKYQHAQQ